MQSQGRYNFPGLFPSGMQAPGGQPGNGTYTGPPAWMASNMGAGQPGQGQNALPLSQSFPPQASVGFQAPPPYGLSSQPTYPDGGPASMQASMMAPGGQTNAPGFTPGSSPAPFATPGSAASGSAQSPLINLGNNRSVLDPVALMQQSTVANRINQYTPWGSLTFSPPDANGQQSSSFSLDPNLQNLFNQRTQFDTSLGAAQQNTLNGIAGSGTPQFSLDTSGLPGLTQDYSADALRQEQATFDRYRSLLDPAFEDRRRATEQRLANMGTPMAGEAENRTMENLYRSENEALQNAALDAVGAGRAEQSRLADLGLRTRGQGINEQLTDFGVQADNRSRQFQELGSLAGLQTTQIPGMDDFFAPGQADPLAAALAAQNSQLANAQMSQQERAALMDGLFGIGASALLAPDGTFSSLFDGIGSLFGGGGAAGGGGIGNAAGPAAGGAATAAEIAGGGDILGGSAAQSAAQAAGNLGAGASSGSAGGLIGPGFGSGSGVFSGLGPAATAAEIAGGAGVLGSGALGGIGAGLANTLGGTGLGLGATGAAGGAGSAALTGATMADFGLGGGITGLAGGETLAGTVGQQAATGGLSSLFGEGGLSSLFGPGAGLSAGILGGVALPFAIEALFGADGSNQMDAGRDTLNSAAISGEPMEIYGNVTTADGSPPPYSHVYVDRNAPYGPFGFRIKSDPSWVIEPGKEAGKWKMTNVGPPEMMADPGSGQQVQVLNTMPGISTANTGVAGPVAARTLGEDSAGTSNPAIFGAQYNPFSVGSQQWEDFEAAKYQNLMYVDQYGNPLQGGGGR